MSQIMDKEMKGSHRRTRGVDWPNDEPTAEKEDDDIAPDGTDYVSKAGGGGMMAMLQARLADKKRGAAKKDEAEGDEERADADEDDAKAERKDAGADDDEGKEAALPPFLNKSFFNYVEESPTLMQGVEQSTFLLEMVKSVGLSFQKMEDNLGYVFAGVHNDYIDFAKGIDAVFEDIGKSLGVLDSTAGAVETGQDSTPISTSQATPLLKGGFGEAHLGKNDILAVLMKGFEDGDVSSQDIVKFETTGLISPTIQKSLGL
jgi:hypothetical protein